MELICSVVSLPCRLPVCRGILSSTVKATSGLANRLMSWVTSPFRETPADAEDAAPADSDEDKGDGEEEQPPAEQEQKEDEQPAVEVCLRLSPCLLRFWCDALNDGSSKPFLRSTIIRPRHAFKTCSVK